MNAVAELPVEQAFGSCTFLNMTGDITIVWDEQNREKILEVIRRKMAEGYVFFTTKKYLFGTITRKAQVSKRDLNRGTINEIIITDEQFDKMVADMDDPDVAELVRSDAARMAKRQGSKKALDLVKRAKSAEEVIEGDSVAVRPVRGG